MLDSKENIQKFIIIDMLHLLSTYFSNSQGYVNFGTDLSISSSEKELGYFWSIQAGFSPTGAAISQKHSNSCLTFSLKNILYKKINVYIIQVEYNCKLQLL